MKVHICRPNLRLGKKTSYRNYHMLFEHYSATSMVHTDRLLHRNKGLQDVENMAMAESDSLLLRGRCHIRGIIYLVTRVDDFPLSRHHTIFRIKCSLSIP